MQTFEFLFGFCSYDVDPNLSLARQVRAATVLARIVEPNLKKKMKKSKWSDFFGIFLLVLLLGFIPRWEVGVL